MVLVWYQGRGNREQIPALLEGAGSIDLPVESPTEGLCVPLTHR